MALILPFHPETATATIVIEGVTYRVPVVDSDGHLQVDVVSGALPSDASTATNQATMITALQLIDDLRAALDAVQTDRLNVNVYRDGASEVKAARKGTASDSTNVVTIATPTSGKKIRLISAQATNRSATATFVEIYFGTGVGIATNPGKEVMQVYLDVADFAAFGMSWPDGGGPIGAVDEVISLRTNINITNNVVAVIHYREE